MPFLNEMISKFDAQASKHLEAQSLNPFSGSFSRSPSPRPSREEYGKPLAGSKTEERGLKARSHINREIMELCDTIYDLATYNKELKKKRREMDGAQNDDDDDFEDDGTLIVTFGELFEMYTRINDKVVGLLIAAKKKGFLYFEKEILFQRQDDDVLIALIKPISEIRQMMKESISPSPCPDRGEQTLS